MLTSSAGATSNIRRQRGITLLEMLIVVSLLAIMSAGAYGMTMASNYNTRGRAAEVLVNGEQFRLIRRRETPSELFSLENV